MTEPDTILVVKTGEMPPMESVLIPAGSFDMGNPSYRLGGDAGHLARILVGHGSVSPDDAGPVRHTTISRRFYLGRTKVTVAQYCAFLNETADPSAHIVLNRWARVVEENGQYRPAEGMERAAINSVPWSGAEAFCSWLSQRTGLTCRLPTEAEWEWAARGTDGRKYAWGDEFRVDVDYGTQSEEVRVGAFPANSTPEGVLDLTATCIAEWCQDWYQDHYDPEDKVDPQGPARGAEDEPARRRGKVLRGREVSAIERAWQPPTKDAVQGGFYGFRVVVEAPVPSK